MVVPSENPPDVVNCGSEHCVYILGSSGQSKKQTCPGIIGKRHAVFERKSCRWASTDLSTATIPCKDQTNKHSESFVLFNLITHSTPLQPNKRSARSLAIPYHFPPPVVFCSGAGGAEVSAAVVVSAGAATAAATAAAPSATSVLAVSAVWMGAVPSGDGVLAADVAAAGAGADRGD